MATVTVAELAEKLTRYPLLDPAQQAALPAAVRQFAGAPQAFLDELVARGWLTAYQVSHIVRGQTGQLLLGSHVLLELLGEGSMGRVYKARHARMGRIVALKIIRKDKLQDPEAVGRFRREMRAIGRVAHANIVTAFDADQDGQTLFYAMEFLEGVDLNRLVRERGPLPVCQACDFIRQAALGLQHAHESGLIHRDIKPSNLFLARPPEKPEPGYPWGAIKILDLGLARLRRPKSGAHVSDKLSQAGWVVGTPDYIAPEQTVNSHTVDERADLYSLGGAFYFLLAGQVPFPELQPLDKLCKHRSEEPAPVEQVRTQCLEARRRKSEARNLPETENAVPAAVAGIVRKLMAKEPAQRFSSARAVAEVLKLYLEGGDTSRLLAEPSKNGQKDPTLRRSSGWLSPELLRWLLVAGAVGIVFGGLLALLVRLLR